MKQINSYLTNIGHPWFTNLLVIKFFFFSNLFFFFKNTNIFKNIRGKRIGLETTRIA
jgi:hypothetical protein